jgi:catechol 2,3-dioxygenase-like lactoylglutathione lyase family enzyme
MPVQWLDHYNIAPRDLEATMKFYTEVIGLTEGYRPPFGVPGAWLYCGDRAVVHLLPAKSARDGPTGRLDHIAFMANDLPAMIASLRRHGCAYDIRTIESAGIHQVFLRDPDGIQVEMSFAIEETIPQEKP